jgi:hypothetical protein
MSTNRLIQANVDIYLHPESRWQPRHDDVTHDPDDVVTIGDLHGNAIKLLFFLIREKAFSITETNYNKLVKIYRKNTNKLTPNDLIQFENIVNNMQKLVDAPLLRLIGDELADRGKNDYFTLLLLKKMDSDNINFDILLSNHSAEFIDAFKKGLSSEVITHLSSAGQDNSIQGLADLLRNNLVKSDDVDDLVQNHYLKHISLLNYEIDNSSEIPEITLFTHAPVNFGVIERLHHQLGLLPQDQSIEYTSIEDVIDRIETINTEFHNRLLDGNLEFLTKSIPSDKSSRGNFIYGLDKNNNRTHMPEAIYETIWGREAWYNNGNGINREIIHYHNGKPVFRIKYVNGHDGYKVFKESQAEFVTNLNNMLGQTAGNDESNKGEYTVLESKIAPVALLADEAIMADILETEHPRLFTKKRDIDTADLTKKAEKLNTKKFKKD